MNKGFQICPQFDSIVTTRKGNNDLNTEQTFSAASFEIHQYKAAHPVPWTVLLLTIRHRSGGE